ncbi:GNAT family N-acetyltransferase [Ramlibacter sp. WS9]|uniref:GNAT family N-acetyltransferase n=1 Tax=Ramlibacter sp. WS9 TaxID=1882741 RepID=UPI0011437568|nr:GNAT family N-acetyltransferase [Ramlibacter sp. WS9]ROZ62269.1 GNAT family N-acetyltransferase [Ramlibacter sp. WS9]
MSLSFAEFKRPAESGDAEEIKALMARVLAGVIHEEPLAAEMAQNTAANVDWWLQNPAQCVHLKCVAGGRIVGVVLVKNFWNLCSLFVEPSMQGQGIGRMLLESAIAACHGRSNRGAVWLNASPNAVSFYRHMGFTLRASDRPMPPGFAAMEYTL